MTALVIRQLDGSDLPEAVLIERARFRSPWSRAMFELELGRTEAVNLAAVEDGRLVGYLLSACHAGDWHLTNLAVAARQSGRGLGQALLSALFERLDPEARLTLEVRPSNSPAISLYERNGFLIAGRRLRYYPDTGEDGLVMWRTPGTLRGSLADVPNADGAPT